MRIFLQSRLKIHHDERNLLYRYDEMLGWFPIANSRTVFTGESRTIHVEHNSRGFRDVEHVVDQRQRLVFLGDSFVWGYDAERTERFSERLREKLPGWSIYNLGVSGYGTDQEYLLLRREYDFYQPNVVFLVFCTDNDESDNSSNVVYDGYFKPFFTVGRGGLELNGVPVPKSKNFFFARHPVLAELYWTRLLGKIYFRITVPAYRYMDNPTNAILSSMAEFIQHRGGKFAIGLQGRKAELESFLEASKIAYVDLSNPYRYPAALGGHWTPEGHQVVSERIYEFLQRGSLITK